MRVLSLVAALVIAIACQSLPAQGVIPPPTPAVVNASFDDGGSGMAGWSQRGEQYGAARVVRDPVASPPNALEMVARGKGSSGNDSFMVFQVLAPAEFRGRQVEFGARVRTDGGASNITLFTPEKFANDFFTDLNSGSYVERRATLDVPANASFLSFGIQVFGKSGARIYVDDAFVRVAGSGAESRPSPAPPPANGASGGPATITIDAASPRGTANANVFGMHLEWSDAGNGIVDRQNGSLRREVVDALAQLHPTVLRFPGGIQADYYNWSAATGPQRRRTRIENVFTRKTEQPLFGTPEFIELLKAVGAEPLITANYGQGKAEDAAAWAEYFKSAGVAVPYWEVGNEIYLADPSKDQPNGRKIARQGEQYAADFPRYRDAIRGVMPQARVGAIAHVDNGAFPLAPSARRDWTSRMLGALTVSPDFVSVHNAYAPVVIDDSVRFDDARSRARVYRALYAAPEQTLRDLEEMQRLLDGNRVTRNTPIAITEWGPLFGYSNKPDVHNAYVDQSRTMAAAVYVASILDALISNPRVLLATYTNPIHRWYGSLLTDTEQGLIRTPSYYVYSLYRSRFESKLVAASVRGAAFNSESVGLVNPQRNVAEVLAKASVSSDGRRLTAMIVNRSVERATPARVTVNGFTARRADCQVLSGSAPNAINGPNLTKTTVSESISPRPLTCEVGDGGLTLTLPPSSIVSMVIER
jgi:alpha-N-arabinofuranosidase